MKRNEDLVVPIFYAKKSFCLDNQPSKFWPLLGLEHRHLVLVGKYISITRQAKNVDKRLMKSF